MHPHIGVIYMSGFAEEQFEKGAIALLKPFPPEALKAGLNRPSMRRPA